MATLVSLTGTDLTSPDKLTNDLSHSQLLIKQKNLGALTLMGPTRNNPVLDPLAELHLCNRL